MSPHKLWPGSEQNNSIKAVLAHNKTLSYCQSGLAGRQASSAHQLACRPCAFCFQVLPGHVPAACAAAWVKTDADSVDALHRLRRANLVQSRWAPPGALLLLAGGFGLLAHHSLRLTPLFFFLGLTTCSWKSWQELPWQQCRLQLSAGLCNASGFAWQLHCYHQAFHSSGFHTFCFSLLPLCCGTQSTWFM